MSSWTSSDVIALSSAVIALCAFFATAWQAWLAHKHNRLSVRPWLVWHTEKRNVSAPNTYPLFGVVFSVKNQGLGPAVIHERYFTFRGERFFKPDDAVNEVEAFIQHVFGSTLPRRVPRFGLPGAGAAIPAGAEVLIADVEFHGMNERAVTNALDALGEIVFHIKYESIYGEPYNFTSLHGVRVGS